MVELLAPAGSPEAVTAAVQSGADAVYLSFDELSGCRKTVNIPNSELESVVRYCRIRGCRVYLALNIPVREDEMQKAAGLALRAQRCGVDAIIVRDLGVFGVLRRLLPEMPLFADTRLGFYTPESAAIAERLGFRRIFLPSDLPHEEILRMAQCSIETAVWVQTPLCAAACGTCRMSAMAGRESAERGLCSELCRESYTLGGRWDTTPLSHKERCLLPECRSLIEAGVTCLAIGSRERRGEYVAAYTKLWATAARENRLPAERELERVERVFLPWGAAKKRLYECAEAPEPVDGEAEAMYAELREEYTGHEARRVNVSFAVAAKDAHSSTVVGVIDEDKNIAALEGPVPDENGNTELSEGALREIMYRTSGTPFRCTEVRVQVPEGERYRVHSLELDEVRRRLLYKLSEERAKLPERKEGTFPDAVKSAEAPRIPAINFSFQTAAQLTPEMAELHPACVYVPIELLCEKPELLKPFADNGAEIIAALPAVLFGEKEEGSLRALLVKAYELGIRTVSAGNLGLAMMAGQEGFRIRGDLDLAVMNGYTLSSLAAAGFRSAMLSPELTLGDVRAMPKPMDTELVVYGRLPVMVTQTCLLKESAGRCSCTTPGQMADTHGGVWPVTKHFGCRNTVWASRKLWLGDVTNEWIDLGLWAVRMCFSTESARECLEVANSYIQGTHYKPNGITRGLYYRGVL